jgi:hypothetical protein
MGETPDQIRNEIEETRERMGDTAEALAYKADVKSRAKEAIGEKKDSLVGSIGSGKDAVVGATDSLVSRVGGMVPAGDDVKSAAGKTGISRENPLGFAALGMAAGFILGTLMPRTSTENRAMGPLSDQVTEKAKEAAQESFERGKAVAGEALEAATDTLQERGSEEAEELTSSLQEKAQEVRQNV